MDITAMQSAISGLRAHSAKAAVAANNIANVNTDGFKASQAVIESGDAGSPEVTVSQSSSDGPIVPETGGLRGGNQYRELSNVDLADEFVQMKLAEHGYRANASIIRAQDEMIGTILDILV
ncbi:MAG: flagellar biosynthesis protein FlgG [Deltaproteobacteria bacterium]|nr:flagellar biosynthesis protein FlgG [Deltaproteobacteria bacterium]